MVAISASGPLGIQTRRDQLLAAGAQAFLARGYTATKVSDIVSAAGVAQGTFYLYFHSKADIFAALLNRMVEAMRAVIDEPADSAPASPAEFEETVVAQARQLIDVMLSNRELAQLCFREALGVDPALAQHVSKIYADLTQFTRQRLERGVELGFLRPHDSAVIADGWVGFWAHTILRCVVFGGAEPDLDHIAREIVSFEFHGLIRPRLQEAH